MCILTLEVIMIMMSVVNMKAQKYCTILTIFCGIFLAENVEVLSSFVDTKWMKIESSTEPLTGVTTRVESARNQLRLCAFR